jgi:diaminopimelate epimerase
MTYLNSDGSRAALCGNASLCSARLATELGIVGDGEFQVETDAGVLGARVLAEGPEVDLPRVDTVRRTLPFRLERGERWIGYALAGVPHLTVRVDDVETVDVVGRGRPLRHESSLPQGANVNFVAPAPGDGWRIRTFERGVEGETLACGSGVVASAVVAASAGRAAPPVVCETRSGVPFTVSFPLVPGSPVVAGAALTGDAREIFTAELTEEAWLA